MLDNCPMCKQHMYEEDFKPIAHPTAMRTAHELAKKESEKVLPAGFDAIDVYTLFFRRIYEHELKRTMKILYKREEHACLLRNLDKDVCGYHEESVMWYQEETFGPKKTYMKNAEDEYRNSKWPKPLVKKG
jgi:hypothetical protein